VEKFKQLMASNWKLILTVLVALGGSFGVVSFSRGDKLEIHIILPEDAAGIFGEGSPVFRGGPDFSESGRRALRTGAWHIRSAAEGRELFAVMRALHNEPSLLGKAEAATATTDVSKLDPITISIAVKIAIQIAIAILERIAPGTATPLDDRLLSLLKLFQSNPRAITAVHDSFSK
jgi:hypothetical protein